MLTRLHIIFPPFKIFQCYKALWFIHTYPLLITNFFKHIRPLPHLLIQPPVLINFSTTTTKKRRTRRPNLNVSQLISLRLVAQSTTHFTHRRLRHLLCSFAYRNSFVRFFLSTLYYVNQPRPNPLTYHSQLFPQSIPSLWHLLKR